jgi:colanic acid/amylovoran biosynthesis glycosyltransferase
MKILILISGQFPFGTREAFLENEVPFLYSRFDKIYIVSNEVPSGKARPTPDHVQVTHVAYKSSPFFSALSLLYVFHPVILKELFFIINNYSIYSYPKLFSVLFASLGRSLKIKSFIARNFMDSLSLKSNSVLIYSYWLNDAALSVAWLKREWPGIKAIARAHRWDIYFETHTPAYLPLRTFIIKSLDRCYCISEHGLNYLNALTRGKFASHLKLSLLGTSNNSLTLCGYNTNKLVLVSCAYIIQTKRVHLIIEALSLIDDIQIEWTHFGHGALMEKTEKLAQETLVAANIKYEFKGDTPNDDILKFYADNKVDLFISSSGSEGLPVSMMEAMSYGIPVIGTDVGGVAEIVEDGYNGFLLTGNPVANDIAQVIENFWKLSENQKQLFRTNAFNTWRTKYNAVKNYTEFANEVESLIAGS